jgi:hypothetical protein
MAYELIYICVCVCFFFVVVVVGLIVLCVCRACVLAFLFVLLRHLGVFLYREWKRDLRRKKNMEIKQNRDNHHVMKFLLKNKKQGSF